MISQTSEYALRAAVHLAARDSDEYASALEISDAIKVPVGYLQKILRMLAKHGILVAQRGSGGGFALAQFPADISVLDVLRASDTTLQRIESCPLGLSNHTGLCALHRLLDQQIAHNEQIFGSTSMADLLEDSKIKSLCNPAKDSTVSVSVSKRRRDAPEGS